MSHSGGVHPNGSGASSLSSSLPSTASNNGNSTNTHTNPHQQQQFKQKQQPQQQQKTTLTSFESSSTMSGQTDPFVQHLLAVLSVYEIGPTAGGVPVPRYVGPGDWAKESILRSLDGMARRMFAAEEQLKHYSQRGYHLHGLTSTSSSSLAATNNSNKKRRSVEIDDRVRPALDRSASGSTNPTSTSTSTDTASISTFSSRSSGRKDGRGRHSSPESSATDADFDMCDESSTDSPAEFNFNMSNGTDDKRSPLSRNASSSGSGATVTQQQQQMPPMNISLDGIKASLDPEKMFARKLSDGAMPSSAPATTTKECFQCPTCARPITDAYPYLPSMYAQSINGLLTGASSVDLVNGAFGAPASDEGSPLVVPPGPLATAAFESGMSAVEELRLLKTQVQDVSRVCQAVARGDLSQKIEVPVQGVVMVQLKDVINTMVSPFCACQMFCFIALDLMRVDFFSYICYICLILRRCAVLSL